MNTIIAVNYQSGKLWSFLQFPLTRIVLAAGVVFIILAYRKGNFVRPYWRRLRSRNNAHAVYEAN